MSRTVPIREITAEAFAPFGDLIDTSGAPDMIINQGLCGRYHDRAKMDFGEGAAAVSLFKSETRHLPYQLDMMERHPLGSQCFIPMSADPFLVIVAEDCGGKPADPLAFRTQAGQAINFHRNIWHGVLTPLAEPGLFAVIDRVGPGNNLEEHWFDEAYLIEPQQAGARPAQH